MLVSPAQKPERINNENENSSRSSSFHYVKIIPFKKINGFLFSRQSYRWLAPLLGLFLKELGYIPLEMPHHYPALLVKQRSDRSMIEQH